MGAISQTPSRLAIFFFFDEHGIVDRYVTTMLEDMAKNVDKIVTVVNGDLASKSYAKLAQYSEEVLLRPNVGLDVGAYKHALDHVGWEELEKFDEVILFNATIMGPVYPFEEMFSSMAPRDIDFWGITWFHKIDADPFGTTPEGYIPRHLQSHFHVYRKSLVSSTEFQDYWDNLPNISNYIESVGMHEAPFTQRFERMGFKSDVYVDTSDMEGFTYQPILFAPKKLIAEKRCPIFKRRSFFHPYDDVLDQSSGQATHELYDYLRDHTEFDTSLIWENALRSMHMDDIVNTMQLNYVLPADVTTTDVHNQKIALFLHLYYIELLEPILEYVRAMPAGSDIFITVGSEEKKTTVEKACKSLPYKVEVRLIENRGRDVSALLVGLKDVVSEYDLVCFIHDKKVAQLTPYSKGDAFATRCFENLLGTPEFVHNIIAKFDQEPNLGILCPPAPNHAEYFPVYSYSWGPNFVLTRKLLEELKVKVPLSTNKDPITPLGTMFWFRPDCLAPLFAHDWKWEDFPPEPNPIDGSLLHAIERAYGLVCQSTGHFVAWGFSDRYARTEITNLSYYVKSLTVGVAEQFGAASKIQMIQALAGFHPFRWRIKGVLRRLIPAPLHQPLIKAYRKVRYR